MCARLRVECRQKSYGPRGMACRFDTRHIDDPAGLGTNRPTASVLISTFEKAGILHVEGRWVTLADRNRLKEAACECYDIIRQNYERVGK